MQGTGNVVRATQAKILGTGNVVRVNQPRGKASWVGLLARCLGKPTKAKPTSCGQTKPTCQGNVIGNPSRCARNGRRRADKASQHALGQTKANTQVNVRQQAKPPNRYELLVETVWGLKTCVFFTSVVKNTSKYGDLASD